MTTTLISPGSNHLNPILQQMSGQQLLILSGPLNTDPQGGQVEPPDSQKLIKHPRWRVISHPFYCFLSISVPVPVNGLPSKDREQNGKIWYFYILS